MVVIPKPGAHAITTIPLLLITVEVKLKRPGQSHAPPDLKNMCQFSFGLEGFYK